MSLDILEYLNMDRAFAFLTTGTAAEP